MDRIDEIARAYRAPLLRFCSGYLGDPNEAEDAVQETLQKLADAPAAPRSPRVWLYTVARNHCLNRLRARGRRPDRARLATEFDRAAADGGHLTRLVGEEDARTVARVMEELPELEREALRLRYLEDLSREEIAEVLAIPQKDVKARLFTGLQRLRERVATSP
jgi:RNA polymerase sigma-70 factor (ECF subfamily)